MKIPWRRKWPHTPAFLPGKSHGQRTLEGYRPLGHRVRHDWMTNTFTFIYVCVCIYVHTYIHMSNCWVCLVTQSCPTLCDPMDCSLPGSSVPGDSPGKNARVGSLSRLQGIFPTQGSNPGLLNCRRILYQLSHKGSPCNHYLYHTGKKKISKILLLELENPQKLKYKVG